MLKYRGMKLIRAGFIGTALIVLVIAVGLQPQQLASLATSLRYLAEFADAGGLQAGNDVKVSGVKVGLVSNVELNDGDALVTFTVSSTKLLGNETRAHIRTSTLLGQRMLTLEPVGTQPMKPMDIIPASRTASPYSLTEAVSDLTTNTGGTDIASLNKALDTLSATIDQIAPQLRPTFDGLSRLSTTLNERNDSLTGLLRNVDNVSAVLSERSQQVNELILNADDLLAALVQRRHAIASLLADTSALAQQLKHLIADNEKDLAPTLERLNAVTAVLEKNRDNIAKALPGMAKYQTSLSEIVASGPYYTAFIPNLALGQLTQPFFDYLFGFRRGTNQGQPPDNAGPRAELPLPYNGIPIGPH